MGAQVLQQAAPAIFQLPAPQAGGTFVIRLPPPPGTPAAAGTAMAPATPMPPAQPVGTGAPQTATPMAMPSQMFGGTPMAAANPMGGGAMSSAWGGLQTTPAGGQPFGQQTSTGAKPKQFLSQSEG